MEYIYSYLEENAEDCQFSLEDLINSIEGEYRPDVQTIQTRLLQKYGDDIIIVQRGKRSAIVCFKNTGFKIITETW